MYKYKDKTEYYKTPNNVIEKVYNFIPNELKNKKITIFDPCSGDGCLCKNDKNFTFIKWDINPKNNSVEQKDFFKNELPNADLVIINPPFNLAKQFIERLIKKYEYIILIGTRNIFKNYWSNVVNEPSLELDNIFENINTPIMVGLLSKHGGYNKTYNEFLDSKIPYKDLSNLSTGIKSYINNISLARVISEGGVKLTNKINSKLFLEVDNGYKEFFRSKDFINFMYVFVGSILIVKDRKVLTDNLKKHFNIDVIIKEK